MIAGRAVSELCRQLAEAAARDHHETLAQILRMAALEAAQTGARYAGTAVDIRERLVGTWDWDILADRVYAGGRFARLFGIGDEQAAVGLPLRKWLDAVHPEDVDDVFAEISSTITSDHLFSREYRIMVGDEVRWVYARGRCTFDPTGRAVRFPGAIVDITHEKIDDQQYSIVPN